jgi:predicted lipoprotein with Yx(FWY)xxD motif
MRRYLIIGAAALLTAACSSSTKAKPAAPVIHGVLGTASTSLGSILTDGTGKTIYRFAIDSPGHSACTGTCAKYWPPVAAPSTLPSAVDGVAASVGSIARPDGTKQLTVGGYPVYTYASDKAPGDVTGQGLNLSGGLWWVLSPTGAEVTTSPSPSSKPGGGGGYGGY